MKLKGKTMVFGGQARLPKELSNNEVLQAVVEIELSGGKVLEAEFSPCPELITGFLKKLMIGMTLPDDAEDLLQLIEQRLYYKGKKAVITAIKDLVREYKEHQYRASKGFQASPTEQD